MTVELTLRVAQRLGSKYGSIREGTLSPRVIKVAYQLDLAQELVNPLLPHFLVLRGEAFVCGSDEIAQLWEAKADDGPLATLDRLGVRVLAEVGFKKPLAQFRVRSPPTRPERIAIRLHFLRVELVVNLSVRVCKRTAPLTIVARA